MRLLVVEDDLPLAEALMTLLTSSGYAVDCVHDGASAEALVAAEQFDLVILDLNLPQMDWLVGAAGDAGAGQSGGGDDPDRARCCRRSGARAGSGRR